MLRVVASRVVASVQTTSKTPLLKVLPVVGAQRYCQTLPIRLQNDTQVEMESSTDESVMSILSSDKITGHDIRVLVNMIQGFDEIPSPAALEAMMLACRKVNDYAMAVRILEAVKFKCDKSDKTYDTLIQAIQPTLEKLGILTPEQMGYDKPELHLKSVFDIHD